MLGIFLVPVLFVVVEKLIHREPKERAPGLAAVAAPIHGGRE